MADLFKRIDTVFIKVSNIDKSLEWYKEVLELELRWRHGNYAAFDVSETALTIYQEDDTSAFDPINYSTFNFYVSDINEAHRHIKSKDVVIGDIQDGGDVQWFSFEDLDGNKLQACYFQE